MFRVRLFHWKASEAGVTIDILRASGFEVEYQEKFAPVLMRQWRDNPPNAFVIDLSRLPSQGMEIAIALRQSPKTRHIPIVFSDGLPEKVEKIRAVLPDAAYCTRDALSWILKASDPVVSAVQPTPMMDRYASRSAAQKLGIVAGSKVVLINAPASLIAALGPLPAGVEFVEDSGPVTLCCVDSVDALRSGMTQVRGLAQKTKLWILWQKKKAARHAGVTESLVRETGNELGLVDYKICSVNETWSAMAFAARRASHVS